MARRVGGLGHMVEPGAPPQNNTRYQICHRCRGCGRLKTCTERLDEWNAWSLERRDEIIRDTRYAFYVGGGERKKERHAASCTLYAFERLLIQTMPTLHPRKSKRIIFHLFFFALTQRRRSRNYERSYNDNFITYNHLFLTSHRRVHSRFYFSRGAL